MVYNILQKTGQIGIPRLMKVLALLPMYSTIETGTLSGPMRSWATWNNRVPLASPPKIRSLFISYFASNRNADAIPTAYLKAITLNLLQRSLVKGTVVSLVALFPFIPNQNVFLLFCPHQPLEHVIIHLVLVKALMMKHHLNESFQLSQGCGITFATIR